VQGTDAVRTLITEPHQRVVVVREALRLIRIFRLRLREQLGPREFKGKSPLTPVSERGELRLS
jgi:hypothetical protein